MHLCSELVRVEFGPPTVAFRLAISSHCLWAEVLHILLRLLVHNICIFQFVIFYNRVHLDLSGILVYCFFHLADSVTYLDRTGGCCNWSYIFSFSVFGCICGSSSSWLCVSGVILGVSGSCGIGVSSIMFLSVIWGASGSLSGSSSVVLGMSSEGGFGGLVVLVGMSSEGGFDALVETMRSTFLVEYMFCFVVVQVNQGCCQDRWYWCL